MNYIELNDLLKEFSVAELARITGDPSGNTINTLRVELAIKLAQAEIDAFLSHNYQLPLQSVSDLIKIIAFELTVYNLYSQFYKNSEIPEQTKWRRLNAISILKLIKSNDVMLDNPRKNSRIITKNTDETNEFELNNLRIEFYWG